MANVLLVEDDNEIREILEFYLTGDDRYQVHSAGSAEEALELLDNSSPDIILLDIMLPGMDGISFCARIRQRVYCPIIFISCLEDDETIIRALNMGGDDYLAKPFQRPMLLAHMESNLRRSRMPHHSRQILTAGELVMDTQTHTVTRLGEKLMLSPTEYEILRFMLLNPNRFIAFEELYTAVWQRPSLGDIRTVYVHVRNLRKKIGDDGAKPRYIQTHKNGGYLFSGSLRNL